ncbi:MAG: PilZ domain-containing protein [Candidatus Omnitrophota bacterium]|jgi:hypothetical protein
MNKVNRNRKLEIALGKKWERERRKYQRYNTEMEVYFRVIYDIRTKVRFQVLDIHKPGHPLKKYFGISKNISVEGLRFVSKKKLKKGDILLLEVYAPNVKIPIQMRGEVRWSRKLLHGPKKKNLFHTAVRLTLVNGRSVADSIHFDVGYKVAWSTVLEAVFGGYKTMVKKLKYSNARRNSVK